MTLEPVRSSPECAQCETQDAIDLMRWESDGGAFDAQCARRMRADSRTCKALSPSYDDVPVNA